MPSEVDLSARKYQGSIFFPMILSYSHYSKIYCESNHSYAISEVEKKNQVFGWGSNN